MVLRILITILVLSLVTFSYASCDGPRRDFCVALPDPQAPGFVNERTCKNPRAAVAEDFYYSGLNIPGNTSNPLGSAVKPVIVDQLPGLNTLGVAVARIDYAPHGIYPPHLHPRASEVLIVIKGTLYVGFVTSDPAYPTQRNRLFAKRLCAGDVFVFPQGLIHFQFNIGKTDAVAFAALSKETPGHVTVANAVFGSDPPIDPDVLSRSFQLDEKVIEYLEAQPWYNNIEFGSRVGDYYTGP